jgi:CheY-like chemotaxis protein
MFEPFFTTKSIGAGTGLGLAVVYGVVTQIGGTITVASAPDRGTTVEITLPLASDAADAIAVNAVPAPDARAVVLLVDDDRAVRTTTRRLLERSNFTVVEMEDGAEALSRFTAEPQAFDVLLSDIRMPHMDGVQLAQAVRVVSPGFPVVFISGFDDAGKQELDAIASVQLVAKPFASAQLFAALRRAIAERIPAG